VSEEIALEFWQGVEQFNRRDYYACHDTLEAIWFEASEPEKTFYQGILQIAVALYHLSNQNLRGAVILLGEGINRLRRYLPDYAAVNVAELVEQSVNLLKTLQQAQPEQVPLFAAQVLQSNPEDFSEAELLHLPRITKL
jgi:predicted metal-dependent hydrolase